ncbi:hypothetical protein V6N11_018906 [Hibiscus sabdariffa]|uniref:RNase H type-1 domain-containing protein n=1 Tax=Hibiscus sabdariffa TaxID=183260 RepID=A0ABR2R0U0_9ROSI
MGFGDDKYSVESIKRIPVKRELAARGLLLNSNTLCLLCGLIPKEVSHLLFSYKVAWLIWIRFATFWDITFVCPSDPGTFLLSWHEASISQSIDSLWHLFPFAILWIIWLLRNDIIFANVRLDTVQLFFLVRTRAVVWFKDKFLECTCSMDELISDPSIADKWGKSKAFVCVKRGWEAPPRGFLKLNVDGAMLTNRTGPPILAELEAILHGLRFFYSSKRFERFRLIVECDCLLAIDWISNTSPCPPAFEPIVRSCRELVLSNSVVLRHIPRYLNLEADALAKEGID